MDDMENKIKMSLLERLMKEMGSVDLDKFKDDDKPHEIEGDPDGIEITKVGIVPNEGDEPDVNGIPSQAIVNELTKGIDVGTEEKEDGDTGDDSDWGSPRLNKKMRGR